MRAESHFGGIKTLVGLCHKSDQQRFDQFMLRADTFEALWPSSTFTTLQ